MTFAYEAAVATGALRQGEVLGPIVPHDVIFPPRRLPKGSAVSVRPSQLDLAVVLTPDCDLNWDHESRFIEWDGPGEDAQTVDYVLMCQLQERAEIRPRFAENPPLWDRVYGNHDRRYHHIPGGTITGSTSRLHPFYLDFKKVVSVRTERLYDGVLAGDIERIALLPEYYVHHLIHRFYGFLSRVALPDEHPG